MPATGHEGRQREAHGHLDEADHPEPGGPGGSTVVHVGTIPKNAKINAKKAMPATTTAVTVASRGRTHQRVAGGGAESIRSAVMRSTVGAVTPPDIRRDTHVVQPAGLMSTNRE
jgi:hypothetical protein